MDITVGSQDYSVLFNSILTVSSWFSNRRTFPLTHLKEDTDAFIFTVSLGRTPGTRKFNSVW
jgi:hypothetical protein